jgi:glucosamine 6-phosphate synthetase-like amidotransferase/phosphosugar isomerase protein
MCGVFGFVSNGTRVDLKKLRAIAVDTERRGDHAHGLAWIDEAGRLRRYKSPGPISRNLRCLELVKYARVIIGHCRYATHGAYDQNENNHPHPSDGGWIVHNGVIHNERFLKRVHNLPTTSDCDSEVLALMIEEGNGTLLERSRDAIDQTQGALVMLGLWSRPARLIVARRGNPLHFDRDDSHNVYLASLADALDDANEFPNGRVSLLKWRNGERSNSQERLRTCETSNVRSRRTGYEQTSAKASRGLQRSLAFV